MDVVCKKRGFFYAEYAYVQEKMAMAWRERVIVVIFKESVTNPDKWEVVWQEV